MMPDRLIFPDRVMPLAHENITMIYKVYILDLYSTAGKMTGDNSRYEQIPVLVPYNRFIICCFPSFGTGVGSYRRRSPSGQNIHIYPRQASAITTYSKALTADDDKGFQY